MSFACTLIVNFNLGSWKAYLPNDHSIYFNVLITTHSFAVHQFTWRSKDTVPPVSWTGQGRLTLAWLGRPAPNRLIRDQR